MGNWMGAYGWPRQVNAQTNMRRDLNVALGAKQPNLNPVFGDALYRGLLDASRKGILSRQMQLSGRPFDYDEDTLGRTPEQAMQNLVNKTRTPQVYNGRLYKPDPNRHLTHAAGPTTSPHVYGLAADIEAGPLRDYMQSPAVMQNLGFETIPGDAPHIQLAGTRQLSKTKGLRSQYAMVDQGKPTSVQTASLGPIATTRAPMIANPPVPRMAPMNKGVPTPRQKPGVSGIIASRGVPTPTMAPAGGYQPGAINAAMNAQAPYERLASPTVGSPPQVSGVSIGRGPRGLNPAAGPIANPDNPGIGQTLGDIQREIDASQKRTQQTSARVHQLQERMNYQAPEAPDPVAALEAARQASQARTQAINARNHQLQERMNYQSPPAPVASNIMDQYRGMIDTVGTRPGMADMRTNIGMPQGDSIDVADNGMGVPSFDPAMGTNAPIAGLPAPPQPGTRWAQKPAATPPPAHMLAGQAPVSAPIAPMNPEDWDNYKAFIDYNRQQPKVHEAPYPRAGAQIAGAAQTKEVQTPEQQAIESVIEGGVNKLGKFANSNYSKAVGKRNQEVTSKRVAMMGGNRIERMESRLARALLKGKTVKSEKIAKKLAEVILAWNIQYTPA